MEHGTYYSYKHKCRCLECKAANAEYVRSWSEINRDSARESSRKANKAYREKHRESIRERHKAWRQRNADRVRKHSVATQSKRRAAKALSIENFTPDEFEELKLYYGNRCLRCGIHESYCGTLNADHVVPISWPGASNGIDNIQPLCSKCNSIKGNRNQNDYRI